MTTAVKIEEEKDVKPVVSTDYTLTSAPDTTRNRRYHVLKLAPVAAERGSVEGRKKAVDLAGFNGTVRLNRRSEARMRRYAEAATGAPVEGGATSPFVSVASSSMSAGGNGPINGNSVDRLKVTTKSRGKTRRVYTPLAPAAERQLLKEERDAWLLEQVNKSGAIDERWLGRLEGGLDPSQPSGVASSYVFFVMDAHSLRIVPVKRTYKFSERPVKTMHLDSDAAEAEYARLLASKDPERWRRSAASLKTTAKQDLDVAIKQERTSISLPSTSHARFLARAQTSSSPGNAPARRRLEAVDGDRRRLGADDDDDSTPANRGVDVEEYDEMDYEDEFQDDEEGAGREADDAVDQEENKQAEERLKHEQLTSIRGGADIGEAEEEANAEDALDQVGKEAKKVILKHDKDAVYESDDDNDMANPYASEEESSSSLAEESPASQTGAEDSRGRPNSRASSVDDRALVSASTGHTPVTSTSGSAAVAKRATSRHARPKAGSRSGTPLVGTTGRSSTSSSTKGSRAASPVPSPSATGTGLSAKRKAMEDDTTTGGVKRHRKATSPVNATLPAHAESTIVAFVRAHQTRQEATTKAILKHIKKQLMVDPRDYSAQIREILERVATSANGTFTLKAGV